MFLSDAWASPGCQRGLWHKTGTPDIGRHVEGLNQRMLWERKAWNSGDISKGEVMS